MLMVGFHQDLSYGFHACPCTLQEVVSGLNMDLGDLKVGVPESLFLPFFVLFHIFHNFVEFVNSEVWHLQKSELEAAHFF